MSPRIIQPLVGNSYLGFFSVFKIDKNIPRFWCLAIRIGRCGDEPMKIAAAIQKLINRFDSPPRFHSFPASARAIPRRIFRDFGL